MDEYTRYKLPDGRIVEYPSSWSEEQALDRLNKDFGPKQQNPFMSGVIGFNTAIERPVQGILQMLSGDNWEGLKQTAKRREEKYRHAQAANPGATLAGDVLGNIGLGAATGGAFTRAAGSIAPVVKNSALLRNILGGALGGAAYGGANYVEPEESRAQNAIEGALYGGGFGAGAHGLTRGVPFIYKNAMRKAGYEGRLLKDLMGKFNQSEMQQALKNDEAAKRLGIKITPAEAGKSNIAHKFESSLGKTDEGERTLLDFRKNQKQLEDEVIQKMIASINENPANAYEEIRNAAQKSISKREKALQAKAKPHYEASEARKLYPAQIQELMKNGIIEQQWRKVLKEPMYKKQIEGFGKNSIKVFDEVKKSIDGVIGEAKSSGDKNKARLFNEAKDQLVKVMDKISPDYGKARAIYSEESPLIDLLRKRDVGKIAKLKDDQIKRVGDIVFDPKQTDMREFNRLASAFRNENPEAWSRMVRNHIENTLDTQYKGRTGYHGTNFYNQFLAKDKSFNKLRHALEGNPNSQAALDDMRAVFKDITNPVTPKGARAQEGTSMSKARSSLQYFGQIADKLTGGHYDKAMIDIITNDKWQDAFRKAVKNPDSLTRGKRIVELLDKVNHQINKGMQSKGANTKGPSEPYQEEEELND